MLTAYAFQCSIIGNDGRPAEKESGNMICKSGKPAGKESGSLICKDGKPMEENHYGMDEIYDHNDGGGL